MIAYCRNHRVLFSFAAIAVMGLAAGCADRAADSRTDFTPVALNAPVNAKQEMPAVPKDAQFTIFCRNFTEENRVADARLAQQQLHDTTKFKKWYVVHSADHSTLYYGFYRTIDPRDPKDAEEGQRAIDDQNAIRSLVSTDGTRVFPECLLVNIETPDPEENPAWDITRAKGEWSIDIADYTVPERKQVVADTVRDMRAHGIEAYYYHGTTASSVCIGCWPAEAVIVVTPEQLNTDPTENIVATANPLADNIAKPLENQGIKTVSTKTYIQDVTLDNALLKWKHHAENGEERIAIDPATGQTMIDPATGEPKAVKTSFLFRIQHREIMDTMAPTVAPLPKNVVPKKTEPSPGELRALPD
jgi:hypothetical protein